MKRKELLDIANDGYGGNELLEGYDEDGLFIADGENAAHLGDSLAEFVVAELGETFEEEPTISEEVRRIPDISDEERVSITQLDIAMAKMQVGITELQRVIDALEDKRVTLAGRSPARGPFAGRA